MRKFIIIFLIALMPFISGCAATALNKQLSQLDQLYQTGQIDQTDYWNARKELISDYQQRRAMATWILNKD